MSLLLISRMGIKKFLKKARTIWETSKKKEKKINLVTEVDEPKTKVKQLHSEILKFKTKCFRQIQPSGN